MPTISLSPAPKRSHYDAVIVGARCAGAATAMLLARAGLKVLAIDRRPYGSDTLSTHALMRPAVLQLFRWGLLKPLRRWTGPSGPDRAAAHDARPHPGRRRAQGRRGNPA
jgi:choline dehydrogenase-like flavoprotein